MGIEELGDVQPAVVKSFYDVVIELTQPEVGDAQAQAAALSDEELDHACHTCLTPDQTLRFSTITTDEEFDQWLGGLGADQEAYFIEGYQRQLKKM